MDMPAEPDKKTNREVLQQIRDEHQGILEQLSFFRAPVTARREILNKFFGDIGPEDKPNELIRKNIEDNIRFAIERIDEILDPRDENNE